MVLRVLLLCGLLVLEGCKMAGGTGYSEYPVEASAATPAQEAGEAEGFGYSYESATNGADPHLDADLDMTREQSVHSSMKAKEGGLGTVDFKQGPATTPTSPLPSEPGDPAQPTQDTPTDQSRRPILIYKARLGLAVFKVQEQLDTIEKMAKDQGGYLVTRTQNEIRVRVPADQFQESVDAILKLGDINYREVTTDDVTAEYTDLEIRLKNALSVRERLQVLLEKAQKVEEALQVERELQRLTDEIETMKGRLKLLKELAAYSTIDVSFSERSSQLKSRVDLPFPWLDTLGLEHLLNL
jgi:hypothetical protein